MGNSGEGREFGTKISFAGKLGTENEKAIDSIANVNASCFSVKIDGVRWTGYPTIVDLYCSVFRSLV